MSANAHRSGISLTSILGISLAAVLSINPMEAGAAEAPLSMQQSVVTALGYNPQLKVVQHNRDAIGNEREKMMGGFYPRLDLLLGYGTELDNSETTRSDGRDDDWDPRAEASLNLTQLLFDGFATPSRVDIETAKYESARHRIVDNAESIALDAIIAHLEVYRGQELVALAEKNLEDHRTILEMLKERQKAGAGSIADVVQTEGRLARAKASLAETTSTLRKSQAQYQRVVGEAPGLLQFAAIQPAQAPQNLDDAMIASRDANPKVLALGSNIDEAAARSKLSESAFYPKLNLELSTSYEDQVESSDTYEKNAQAMVRLRWNLFNGTSDVYDRRATIARKNQAIYSKNDQLVQALAETRSTWAQYRAAKEQVTAFKEAVDFNDKTLDAYMKQFKVAQRTLLDVLDARNELFQSSGLLITAQVNENIAAYRLLALGGKLNQALGVDPAIYTAQQDAKQN